MLLLSMVHKISSAFNVLNKGNKPDKMLLKKKIIGRSRIYDILHKGWVNVCALVSVATFGVAFYAGTRLLTQDAITNEEVVSTDKEAGPDLAPTIDGKQGELL